MPNPPIGPFGPFGPFGGVFVPSAPLGLGYGGHAYGYSSNSVLPRPPLATTSGYGGASEGAPPYGNTISPRPRIPTTGSYGGKPHGTYSYGSTQLPRMPYPPGSGYGASSEGESPYGATILPRPPYPPGGGFGGIPYGLGLYGSHETDPPRVTSAISIDGHTIEVFFSEDMEINGALLDPASYTFNPILGAPVQAISITTGTAGSIGGVTSVLITHSGTTLGGTYEVVIVGPTDRAGNSVESLPTNRASFYTFGDSPTVTAEATAGNLVLLTFSEGVLPESSFSPGIEDTTAYLVDSGYPVPVTVLGVAQQADLAQVALTVQGMTSVEYTLTVGPATAFDYVGDVLPSASSDFIGTEAGTGTSEVNASGLLLSKAMGDTYGWQFEDTSGRVVAGASVRVDLELDPTSAAYAPPLYDATFGTLSVSDGVVQVDITLNRVAGTDVLDISSGAFSAQVPASWSTQAVTITLLRNEKGSHYGLLFNGTVVLSASDATFDGAAIIPPGAKFLLAGTYDVTQLPVSRLSFLSTQTIFGSTWNFVQNGLTTFIGSSATARDHFFTARGPVVKNWGDATPATTKDVTVRVNNVEVDVSDVNPYTGMISLAVPIPMTPPGTVTVDTDYKWHANPILEFAGLNTMGLVLNKWNRATGHDTDSPSPSGQGVMDVARFPMGLVLGPMSRPAPVLVGHRYMGFEKAYTASLNSPTTLLLNRNPNKVSIPYIERTPEGVSVAFEGTTDPTQAENPWELTGSSSGSAVNLDGTYTLESSGVSMFHRAVDFSEPTSVVLAGRAQVAGTTSFGVFSGVALGLHDNRRLYALGFLTVNGLQHVGLLQDATRPDLVESWSLAPSVSATLTSSSTFTISSTDFSLSFISAGARFQVLDGVQAGTYTITDVVLETDGSASFSISGTFPVNYFSYDGNVITVVFETVWDSDLTTYRMVVDTDAHRVEVLVGGTLSGSILSTDVVTATPAQTALVLPTSDKGAVFWGAVYAGTASTSIWSFLRYGTTPDQVTFSSRGVVVAAEMSKLPEEDANHEWFITAPFGYSELDVGPELLLKNTAESETLDLSFAYERVEPTLAPNTSIDMDATFRVDSGVLGAGDGQVRIRSTDREVLFSTILYLEGGSPYRKLLQLPAVSISGLAAPTAEGWEVTVANDLDVETRVKTLIVNGKNGIFSKTLALTDDASGGRIIEARFALISSDVSATGDMAPVFGADVGLGAGARRVQGALKTGSPNKLVLSSGSAAIAEFPFEWADGAQHTYRLLCDPTTATISVVVDDVVLGTTDLTLFDASLTDDEVFFGASSDASAEVEWDGFSVCELPPLAAKRTLGVLRNMVAGDVDDIDNWELPRTDTSEALNSEVGAVIEEMDWRSDVSVRIRLDPQWGCTVFRPDLPLPPYYTGRYASESTEPSAGWINVEYRNLPQDTSMFGTVAFGAIDSRALSQQRWTEVRYRVYGHPTEDYISPHHMVLNQFNVIHSGELGRDISVEQIEVESLTSTLVSLRPANINASRIFKVMVGDTILAASTWAFDKDSQSITLVSPLAADHVAVTVYFAPGLPVTETYLTGQPFEDTNTLLNEGTPPYPKNQIGPAIRSIVFGSAINDPNDTLSNDPDFITNDHYRSVKFTDDPELLYEQLSFFEDTDGGRTGLIASLTDGPAPGEGFSQITISGSSFTETARGLVKDPPFSQATVLFASGGVYKGGHIGPGTAVLFPSYPARGIRPGSGTGGSRQITTRMRLTSVLTDAESLTEQVLEETGVLAASDATPPSEPAGVEPNPGGASSPNGSAILLLVDGAGLFSRVGPWGGVAALRPESLLYGASGAQPSGVPASGAGMILSGGAVLGLPTRTVVTVP